MTIKLLPTGNRYGVDSDIDLAIALGRVKGVTTVGIVGINSAVSSTLQDIWDAGGIMVYPTTSETWEILSGDANDTLAGTGARTALVIGLDINNVVQQEVVNLNGTTPVVLTNSYFRPRQVIIIAAGSGGVNAGAITVRVESGGNTRLMISAGNNISFSSHYTVPAGKVAVGVSASIFVPKNEEVTIRTSIRTSPTSPFIFAAPSILFEQGFQVSLQGGFSFAEGADIRNQISSLNPAQTVTAITTFRECDADYVLNL